MILENAKNIRTKVLICGVSSNHGFKAVVTRYTDIGGVSFNHGFKAVVSRYQYIWALALIVLLR